jgi:hypothetical protein
MRVYIAAPYPWRDNAIAQMRQVEAAGFEVTSTWLRAVDTENDVHARLDLADVARADVLVAINPPAFHNAGTGGRHVELGYAIALAKTIVLVGAPSNIFHHLSDVVHVPDCSRIVEALEALPAPPPRAELDAMNAIVAEFYRAEAKHKPMNSHHEGYAVILEELDELWDDVKADRKDAALKECVQVGAMALRFIANLTPKSQPSKGDPMEPLDERNENETTAGTTQPADETQPIEQQPVDQADGAGAQETPQDEPATVGD